MSPGRRDLTGLGLLAATVALWLARAELGSALAARLPGLGHAWVALLMQAAVGLLACAAAYGLRHRLIAAGRALIGRIDRLEERLDDLPRGRSRLVRAVAIGLGVGATVLVLFEGAGFGSGIELRTVDAFFRLQFPERSQAEFAAGLEQHSANSRDDVVILALDDATVSQFGWPMARIHYARLIDTVAEADPRSLTFDVSLVDPSRNRPDWDEAIGEAAGREGNVGFTFTIARSDGDTRRVPSDAALAALEQNTLPWHESARGLPDYTELIGGNAAPQPVIDPLSRNAHVLAMANVLLDGADDVLRHSLVVARLGEQLYPSLSLRLAAETLGVPLSEIRVYPGSHVDVGSERRIPIDQVGRTLVRYQGRHSTRGDGPFPYVSLWDLLRGDARITLVGNLFGDDQQFVLDGTTRVRLDGREVPLTEVPAARLREGVAISGVARYSTAPGQVFELDLDRAPAPDYPEFELLDEHTLRFHTTVGSLQRQGADLSLLTGKHLLVGSTALAAADLKVSPLGEIPGVEHHATMLSNLLQGELFHQAPLWARVLLIMAAALLAAAIAVTVPAGAGLLVTALGLLALLTACFAAFASGLYVPVVAPSTAMGSTYLLSLVLGARAARNARGRAARAREGGRRTGGRYLTEQVVEQLLDSPDGLKLGGQRDFVTIMMTDLRGFTSMCGTMEPEDVVKLLNHYLEKMTRIITRYGGTIDEFIGDAILVVFGAPLPLENEELRAVACAIEMLNAMPEVNRWNEAQGLPKVEMGIGIHSGEVVLGNIGSELRAKYGIVGSTINLTARVESYTVGGQVLLSETTRARCGDALTIGATQVVSPKGVKGTLEIHEAIAVAAPFEVELRSAEESLVSPTVPLELRYGTIKNKQVAELSHRAVVEAISELGMELRVDEELPVLSDLQLRVFERTAEGTAAGAAGDAGLRNGDLYGKVLKSNVRPNVIYLRLTSVPAELQPVLDAARGGTTSPPPVVTDSALVST